MNVIGRTALAASTLALLAVAATGPALALDKVRYGLSWLPQGEHCGFFQARDTGLYEKAGLDVEIVPGGPGVNMGMMVAGGRVDFGMGSSFTTLNLIKQDVPAVTVAAMFQKNPQTLVAHPDQGIAKLEDLKGKPVMVANFSRNEFWQFLKARYGFDDAQLRPYTYNAGPFLADKTAVQQGYVTEDAFFLGKELGKPPVIFLLADHGYAAYATTIYTLAATVAAKPDLVQRFVDASILGWKACMDGDPTPAKKAIMAANPEHSAELFDFKLAQMKAYSLVTGAEAATSGIGAMSDARWKDFYETMVKAGVYTADIDYKKAYTLAFVNKKLAM
ncbi:MAG: ABC transporter substrate-binding protein [Alphaproteobacteria bacterium]